MLSPPSYLRRRSAARRSRSPPVTRLPFLSSTTSAPPSQRQMPRRSLLSPSGDSGNGGSPGAPDGSVDDGGDRHDRAGGGDLAEVLSRLGPRRRAEGLVERRFVGEVELGDPVVG